MPLVETKKLTIQGHCTPVRFVCPWEEPLAKRRWGNPKNKLPGAKMVGQGGTSHYDLAPCDHTVPQALSTKNIEDVDREYKACAKAYTQPVMDAVYPDKDDFRKAVEKAILSYCARTEKPAEVILKAKSLGLATDQAKALADRGFRTVEQVKGLDLTKLSSILFIDPDKAQALRQKWWGADDEDKIPVILTEDE